MEGFGQAIELRRPMWWEGRGVGGTKGTGQGVDSECMISNASDRFVSLALQADDEYMISDASLPTNRFVSVPKSYGSFNPGALVAGIIRGLLDAAGFPAQ